MKSIFYILFIFIFSIKAYAQIPVKGLSVWLKSDIGIITNGKDVIEWKDQSGNNNNAISTTNNKPQIASNVVNGYSAVRFNGLNTGMRTNRIGTFPNKRGTIFIVSRTQAKSSTSSVGMGTVIATYHGDSTTWQITATPQKFSFYDGVGGESLTIGMSLQESNWNFVMFNRDNDSTMQFDRDGRFMNRFPITNNQPYPNKINIGYNALSSLEKDVVEVFNGDIAEIIIYNRSLNEDELSFIYDYISKKYKFQLAPKPYWKTWWFYASLVLVVFTTIFSLYKIVNNIKLKRKVLELEKERQIDKERIRISREMHDDIGAGLTQISMMSESLKHKRITPDELEAIANTSRKLVSSMSEIIWSLHSENKTLQQLYSYLREQLSSLLEYSKIEYYIDFPDTHENIVLSNEQLRNILLSIKEIVNNAVKYSKASKIKIDSKLDANSLVFHISDNGIGFDLSNIKKGNGLKNIKNRISEIGGEVTLISNQNIGTNYTIKILLVQ